MLRIIRSIRSRTTLVMRYTYRHSVEMDKEFRLTFLIPIFQIEIELAARGLYDVDLQYDAGLDPAPRSGKTS